MTNSEEHLHIGAIVFPKIDQADLTGPFEVLAALPNSTFHVIGRDLTPVRDIHGLILTPDTSFADAPQLDLLVVPGGYGQEALMEDWPTLDFLQAQSAHARHTMSVCTGALLCGAAGLLIGVRATTHWASFALLPYFGAIPVDERVVVDGKHISTAGVTAGTDGALRAAELLRGRRAAEDIQLTIQYSPQPPFDSGSPRTAPPQVLAEVTAAFRQITGERLVSAKQAAARLGIHPPSPPAGL